MSWSQIRYCDARRSKHVGIPVKCVPPASNHMCFGGHDTGCQYCEGSNASCVMITRGPPAPSPPRGQTDTYENITFPRLRLRTVNIFRQNTHYGIERHFPQDFVYALVHVCTAVRVDRQHSAHFIYSALEQEPVYL